MESFNNFRLFFLLGCLLLPGISSAGIEDMGFSLDRTYPAEIGDMNATVWCRASQPIQSRMCTMRVPGDFIITLDLESGAVSTGSTALEGYTAFTDQENRKCGIRIQSVVLEDLGQWECMIENAEAPNQIGFVNLLNNEMGFVKDVRLPRHVLPVSYNLSLIPFIIENNYTIDGNIRIESNIVEAENNCDDKCIVMHTRDTYIDEESVLVSMDGFKLTVSSVGYDKERDYLILYLEEPLTANLPLTISFHFISQLQDNLAGFYRSSYYDNLANVTKTIATTQFESTDARRAFPCFDEPDMKANFTIGLGRKKNMISLSNMPKSGLVELNEDYVMDMYETSVRMSTYLLAFIVSEFGNTFAPGHENFKIWAQEEKIPELEYAADIGPKIVEFYEELFDYKFPLEKMDMAAIPDFQSGAMENWGLITYRDTAILYNQEDFSQSSRLRVVTVVAHELAHQWFGNLVTMKWWNDLWLNEGFASYIEYLGADHVAPEMKLLDQILNFDVHDVFYLDSLPSSHSISVNIENPIFQENFDRISYGKGSVLIRMMENFLTKKTFRQGLANYFKAHAYSNAEQDDLWASLEDQAQEDGVLNQNMTVKQIMDTWTLQKGYPVLNVDFRDGNWEISQEKFNLNVEEKEKSEELWKIPISYRSLSENLSDTTVNFWLSEAAATIPANSTDYNETYIFNIGQMGYYRVNYSPENWNRLIKSYTDLPNLSRAQLVDDALNLARAGQLTYSIALELVSNIRSEMDYVTLGSAKNSLQFLMNMLAKDERFPGFQEYVRALLQDVYQQVSGSNSNEYMDVVTRSLVLDWACSLGIQDCIDTALIMIMYKVNPYFTAKLIVIMHIVNPDEKGEVYCTKILIMIMYSVNSDEKGWVHCTTIFIMIMYSVNPDEKGWVYCTGIKYGNEEDWDLAWDRLQKTNVLLEKSTLMTALGCTKDTALIDKYLERSIDPNSTIRTQDKRYVYLAIGDSSEADGSARMLTWLEDNWEKIKEFYGDTFVYNVKNMVLRYPEYSNTQESFDKLRLFLSTHRGELGSSAESVDQSLDKISANIRWRELFYEDIFTWVEGQ
ncbi:aminopeptidase N [Eurytemora carolleeae]|uniref:aminopeptidase N n=1 Tax=Eurytemora carolleeae TaxID=1294199 RepID=UPI000C78C794|nr:aminopeptidase N [Eurytemora carolleeae]|eukprot:XP_023321022.1 aminopeptidase N-like [Eurytemora affinis]